MIGNRLIIAWRAILDRPCVQARLPRVSGPDEQHRCGCHSLGCRPLNCRCGPRDLGRRAGWGAISSRAQTRHWTLTTQAEACAGVLREYTQVSMALSRASLHPESLPEGRPLLSWAPWNQALAVLNLVADHRIVAAAHRIDAVFWELNLQVRRGELKGSEWFTARNRMEAARLDFVNTARQLLARPGPDLPRLSGRPDPSDPVWREPTAARPKPVPGAPTQSQDSS